MPDSRHPTMPSGDVPEDSAPRMVGPYQVLETLGQGGMGTVYLAQQHEGVKRRVACKLIKLGMDSQAVIRRFEQERQALALMDHPGIAKVFDCGTTERGQPFFVMELVDGVPLDAFCEQRRLPLDDRLRLIQQICGAVQHAHQKGVVHRDLKPGNVLVGDSDGLPHVKIIDFGLAKAMRTKLTEATLQTEADQILGTPEYMAPEQADLDNQDIDTRADVYSLGVMLYELLVGDLPFPTSELRKAGIFESLRRLREDDPPRPSTRLSSHAGTAHDIARNRQTALGTLTKALRNDLDWVVMKALEKDRDRRYETANALAEDLQRFLDHEPLVAGPPSATYRLRKLVRRHRGQVLAGALVLLALIGGSVGTFVQFVRAEREAKQNAQLAKEKQALATAETAAKIEAQRLAVAESQARREIESSAYFANVQMAAAWIGLGKMSRARERLLDCPPPLRNWEWHWLMAEADDSLQHLDGHQDDVTSCSYSPDGARLLTASSDHTARVWDTATGLSLLALEGHTGAVTSASWSPDGQRLATASADATARIWDAATGALLAQLNGHDQKVQSAAWSPDGKQVVTASGEPVVRVWDAASGALVATLECPAGIRVQHASVSSSGTRILGVSLGKTPVLWQAATGRLVAQLAGHSWDTWTGSFSPDGTQIVTGSIDKTARIWDADTGAPIAELKGAGIVCSASISPGGSRALTVSPDKSAIVWDAASGEPLLTLGEGDQQMRQGAFSPDGLRIVTASQDDDALLWDATTGALIAKLQGHGASVWSVAWSPTGTRIATASEDGSARLWDASPLDRALAMTGHSKTIWGIAIRSDGERMVSASEDASAKLWDTATGANIKELRGHTDGLPGASLSPDGTRIVTCSRDRTARVWDANTGDMLFELRGHAETVYSAQFRPDGAQIVTTSQDRTARVWDAATGAQLVVLRGHTEGIDDAEFNPDGMRVLTASIDRTARIFDLASGDLIAELAGHSQPGASRSISRLAAASASFSPDGSRIVTATGGRTARLWNATTGALTAELRGHVGTVLSAEFNSDGTRVLTASTDGTARVWDPTDGSSLAQLEAHTDVVYSALFSPDDARVVTVSQDTTARIWDAATGTSLVELTGHSSPVRCASFSPDGTWIVTGSTKGSLRIWDAARHAVRFAMRQPSMNPNSARAVRAELAKQVRGEAAATWLTNPSDLAGRIRLGN